MVREAAKKVIFVMARPIRLYPLTTVCIKIAYRFPVYIYTGKHSSLFVSEKGKDKYSFQIIDVKF